MKDAYTSCRHRDKSLIGGHVVLNVTATSTVEWVVCDERADLSCN
jgi:hypothetical protein